MATFFVLYLPDRASQACLDVMRLLCEPEAQSPAHVTVRGPYMAKPEATQDWRNVKNIHVTIDGIGTFFNASQNTVFLRCKASEFQDILWKKDYKNGIPHITIYNGSSREFALHVAEVLSKFSWRSSFVADRLHEYVSPKNQMRLDLRWGDYNMVFRQVFGFTVTREQLRELSDDDRLKKLGRIAHVFSTGTTEPENTGMTKLRECLA